MIGIYTWAVLITGIFFTGFGVFVYLKNPKALYNSLFGLLSLAFAIWSYGWYLLITGGGNETTLLLFARILILGSTFIPVIFLHWVLSVLDLHKKRKFLLFLSYLITLFFASFSFSNLYIVGVYKTELGLYWPISGPYYSIFLIIGYGCFVLYAIFELLRHLHKEQGEKRYQMVYIIIGSILGFGGGAMNFPLMYKINLFEPLTIFLMTASPFVLSYAALKYNLMNTKVIAGQFFVGAINLLFLINLLQSESVSNFYLNLLLLVFVLIFSFIFIKSISKEVKMRKQVEILAKDLEDANVKLTEASRQKSEFLSIASHQFRSPLAAIKGYASLILEGSYGNVGEKIKQPIKNMFDSTNNLALIVDDFLNVSRIEQGRMEYKFENAKVNEIIENVINEMKPSIDESGLKFSFDYDKNEKFDANVDTSKFRQVITNLVDNALKYTKSGWLKLELNKTKEGKILLKISDSGVGIPKNELPNLFTLFKRAGNANKVNVKGTGLGLYIVKKIIEAHNGKVWVESEGEGKGAQFYVEI